jgi:hypothetical protein
MKRFALLLLFAFTCSGFGQTLSQGTVTFALEAIVPGTTDFIYDFTVAGGFPEQKGGHLPDGFGYNAGTLTLEYTQAQVGNSYNVTANFVDYAQSPMMDDFCSIVSANLTDVTLTSTKGGTLTNLVGEYAQLTCLEDGVYWYGPGGITIHASRF